MDDFHVFVKPALRASGFPLQEKDITLGKEDLHSSRRGAVEQGSKCISGDLSLIGVGAKRVVSAGPCGFEIQHAGIVDRIAKPSQQRTGKRQVSTPGNNTAVKKQLVTVPFGQSLPAMVKQDTVNHTSQERF
jgi:hypothetical protein